jgi:hypothetical protein
MLITARGAAEALKACWELNDKARLRIGARQLAGLGGGLTPAGDDFLAGLMLGAWLIHPQPSSLCQVLIRAAVPHTTVLSGAMLRAAARGEFSAHWHELLAALAAGGTSRIARATRRALAHGATSGGDALAGFLWAGACQGAMNPYSPQS